MTKHGRERFCANEMFETIVREHAPDADGFYGNALLFRHLIDRTSEDYGVAVESFRSSLQESGFEPSTYEVKRMPAEIELLTAVRSNREGRWIEVKFFNVFPTVPDTVLNALAVALTVGGLVTAPVTGGASILISCIAMGFAITNNSKKETDPTRLQIYQAIGEIASRKAQNIAHENYPKSALSKQELASVLNLTEDDLESRLPVYLENAVLALEDKGDPAHYRSSSVSSSEEPEEYQTVRDKVEKATVGKWQRLNKRASVYPTLEEISEVTGLVTEIVRQGIEVLMQKKVVSRKPEGERNCYWYTV